MNEQDFPNVTIAFIQALEDRFPVIDFPPTERISELNYHYGQRSVISFLKSQYEIQNENVLNTKLK
jgi:hypothetical protein